MIRKIEILSEVSNLRRVEKFIDDLSLELDLSDEIYGNILVATMEAANNAIIHGNKGNPEKRVNLIFEKMPDYIIITIADQGSGFDYKNVPDPTSPKNIEKINGRGVFLMQNLSNEIEFFDEGRKVQLKFNL